MDKKILIILLILVAGACSLNAVFSSGFLDLMEITPLSEDTNVSIDEFNFIIPEGYGESEGERYNETNDYGITTIQYNYFNDDGKLVGVTVIYNGEKISFDDFDTKNFTSKKIADKDGMYKSEDNQINFFYIENNKYISLSAPDEDIIEKMITGE